MKCLRIDRILAFGGCSTSIYLCDSLMTENPMGPSQQSFGIVDGCVCWCRSSLEKGRGHASLSKAAVETKLML